MVSPAQGVEVNVYAEDVLDMDAAKAAEAVEAVGAEVELPWPLATIPIPNGKIFQMIIRTWSVN